MSDKQTKMTDKPSKMETKSESIKKIKKYGTKTEVYNGEAEKTKGGLVKDDLEFNSKGGISSKKRIAMGKALYEKRLARRTARMTDGNVEKKYAKL